MSMNSFGYNDFGELDILMVPNTIQQVSLQQSTPMTSSVALFKSLKPFDGSTDTYDYVYDADQAAGRGF